jgi:hypothetical protein
MFFLQKVCICNNFNVRLLVKILLFYSYTNRNVSSYQLAQAAPTLERNGGGGKWGGGDACPRCCKQVYFAEEVRAVGKKWHKMCLSCGEIFAYLITVIFL